MLTVFQCITMEGWTDVLYWVICVSGSAIHDEKALLTKAIDFVQFLYVFGVICIESERTPQLTIVFSGNLRTLSETLRSDLQQHAKYP